MSFEVDHSIRPGDTTSVRGAVLDPNVIAVYGADAVFHTKIEWDSTGSTPLPIYIGEAAQGSVTNASTWRIQKLTWDTSGSNPVPTDVQVLNGSWDNRAALAWE